MTIGAQTISGFKKFPDGATANIYDIRDFGAVPGHDTDANQATFDCTSAFYAAIAAWTQNMDIPFNTKPRSGGIYIPTGTWYISQPLCFPAGCHVWGDGSEAQAPSVRAPETRHLRQWCRPLPGQWFTWLGCTASDLISGAAFYNLPTYSTALIGSGVALDVAPVPNRAPLWLHDAYPWVWTLDPAVRSFSLRFWVQIEDPTTPLYKDQAIIGSFGPVAWTEADGGQDIAYGVLVTSDGVNTTLTAYLTTDPTYDVGTYNMHAHGVKQSITSSPITLNTPINIELDYNGAFFDFYVDGVNQGHVAAVGPLCRAPWEGTSIGGGGPELDGLRVVHRSFTGVIDSIEVSDIARHGQGSFTPHV